MSGLSIDVDMCCKERKMFPKMCNYLCRGKGHTVPPFLANGMTKYDPVAGQNVLPRDQWAFSVLFVWVLVISRPWPKSQWGHERTVRNSPSYIWLGRRIVALWVINWSSGMWDFLVIFILMCNCKCNGKAEGNPILNPVFPKALKGWWLRQLMELQIPWFQTISGS